MIPYRTSATSGLQNETRVAATKVGILNKVRRVWASMLAWGVSGSIRRLPRVAHSKSALKANESVTKVAP